MLRRLNLTIALLSILGFANSAFASVYQTVDLSTGVNVGAIGNPLYPVNGRDDFWIVRSVLNVPSPPNTPSWITALPTG